MVLYLVHPGIGGAIDEGIEVQAAEGALDRTRRRHVQPVARQR